ncbi:FAD-dependent oxidoreductase [Candidatus Saccharibacteria bacterium]|nr:FAD-dependent oxidoreductase [Candidatus Saccharibacteria bacterium]
MKNRFDRIIIGAGIYGLYAALQTGKRGERVLVLEKEGEAFKRATYINQARVHMGYHYPRSLSTALKSAGYFEKFNLDYGFSVLKDFDQVYATSSKFSWTDAKQFQKFCDNAGIKCEEVPVSKYFKNEMVDGAFLTKEYTYDAKILRDYFLKELAKLKNVEIKYGEWISGIKQVGDEYEIKSNDKKYYTKFLLNATYAGVNEILEMLKMPYFKIKYELCEVILCEVNEGLNGVGLTVMDGPFFSIMPFGKTGMHSLTSVTFTPHETSYGPLPTFQCQKKSEGYCKPTNLGNCNDCPVRPESAWEYMANLARKYMRDELEFHYKESLFSMKPILTSSEIDDSRPTVIKKYQENPTFVSVLSGKINTIYDLNEVLK